MTLAKLNAKLETTIHNANERVEARHLRDERLGHLGVFAGMEPTEAQVDIVNAQLFGEEGQGGLL